MGRLLQFVDAPKRIFEITARSIQGRFLLRPSPECNRRMLGVIARSLEVCGGHVELFMAGGTSNHIHFIVGVTDADWKARWKSHLFTNLSKEIGDIYDWPGPMLERRGRDIAILDDDALVDRLVYVMSHGVKEGLVASWDEWPGINWVGAATRGDTLEGAWYDRTLWHRLRRRWDGAGECRGAAPCLADVAETKTVELAVPPMWRHLDAAQIHAKWRELAGIALERFPPPDKVLGRAGVLAVHPHHRPTGSKRSPAPKVHTTCWRLRAAWLAGYAAFVDAYRAALQRLREGWEDASFPPQGCLPACLLGAPGG